MCIMIPVIIARINPIILLVIMGFRNSSASRAPKGSAKAEISVYPTALFLLLVAE